MSKRKSKPSSKPSPKPKPAARAAESDTVNLKKSSVAGLVITIVVLVALIAGAIGGAAVYLLASQTKMPSWADTYLAHIKSVRSQDAKTSANSQQVANNKDDAEAKIWADPNARPEVGFYESTNNSPMMIVNYTTTENEINYNSVAIYSIQNEEIYLLNYENTNFYYAYNIDAEFYDYYLKFENSNQENTYINIDNYFKEPDAPESNYETTCSTDETAKDYCGDIFAIEPVEIPSFEYSDEMSDQELTQAVTNTADELVTEEAVQEQTAEKLQQSAAEAQTRIEEKAKVPEFFMVDGKQIKYGQYESVSFEGDGSGQVALTLNPDMTATYFVYDYDTDTRRQVTTGFEVRPIRNGDVLSTSINCAAADGGACFNSSFNGRTGLIIAPDGVNNMYPQTFLVTHEAASDPSKRGGSLPYGCDFEPAAGVVYYCYRFLGKE